ncbi:MAG: MBL fold metallo-hydrolase [Clostridiales bacterium]|nr:MBL fold metallo-hydrolase [Clostridiales bacterium]
MKFDVINLPPVGTNCYIIYGEKIAVIIDPASNAEKILSAIEKSGKTLAAVLLTHGHFDHIGAAEEICEKTAAPLYIHDDDVELLTSPEHNASKSFDCPDVTVNIAATPLTDGQKLVFDDIEITVMHTPGHTKGSVCYFCGDDVFTGDTLFEGGYGRTDLYGGDFHKIIASLKKLLPLVKEKRVHPGH